MKNITQFQLRRNARISPARQSQLRARVEQIFAGVVNKFNLPDRALGRRDFLRVCQEEDILLTLKNKDEAVDEATAKLFQKVPSIKGFYARQDSFKIIYLRCFLLKNFDRFTAFHELGHHFAHHITPQFRTFEDNRSESVRDDENEYEADYFALLALGQAEVWQ